MEPKSTLELGVVKRMSLEELESFVLETSRPPFVAQSWSLVRDWCVGNMQDRELSDGQRIRWGELAVQAARLKHREGGIHELDAVSEEVLSRSYLIKVFGPGEPCSARDPIDLVLFSIERIGRERDEVSRAAEDWPRLPVPDILSLRRIKNIMKPLCEVTEYLDEGSLRDDLSAWLALIPALP
ncbi:hypothetical protein [Streptomyces sp. NPDC020480]|uniref:hypothetical protein n=1 Tax=Streptomyces sp. NPDC020480 TaxID=3365076 RepID=UPI0037A1E5C2